MHLVDLRLYALTLPGTTEEPHFDLGSFRVRGKLYATWTADGLRLHVFVDEERVRAAVAAEPASTEELWWGKKLSGVRVRLDAASPEHVHALLRDAWARKAPRRMVR